MSRSKGRAQLGQKWQSLRYMSVEKKGRPERHAKRWAQKLMASVRAVLTEYPKADPDNVRHTLILLQHPPLERLRKSLTRGRALAQRK